jgi:hypothetical protein
LERSHCTGTQPTLHTLHSAQCECSWLREAESGKWCVWNCIQRNLSWTRRSNQDIQSRGSNALCSRCVLALCAHAVCSRCVLTLCAHAVCSRCVLALCARAVCSRCVLALCARAVCSRCVLALCAHAVCSLLRAANRAKVDVSEFKQEAELVEKLREFPPHKNLVNSVGISFDPPLIVSEFVDGGDLLSHSRTPQGQAMSDTQTMRSPALCAVRCALCAVRCALCAVRCALCAVCCVRCAVFFVF